MFYEKIINKVNKIKIVFCMLFLLVGLPLNAEQEVAIIEVVAINPDLVESNNGLVDLDYLNNDCSDCIVGLDLETINNSEVANLKIADHEKSVIIDTNTGLRFTLLQDGQQYTVFFVCDESFPLEFLESIVIDMLSTWFNNEIYQQVNVIVFVLKFEYLETINTGKSLEGNTLAALPVSENSLQVKALNPVSFTSSMVEEIKRVLALRGIETFKGDLVSDNLLTDEQIREMFYANSIDSDFWYFKDETKAITEGGAGEEQVDFNNAFKGWTDAIKELEDEELIEELMKQENDELVNIIAADEDNNVKLIIKKIDSGELTMDQHKALIVASCRQKNASVRKKLVQKYKKR